MFTAAALVPSPLILVPELNGAGAASTDSIRAAAVATAAELGRRAQRWTVVGVGDTEQHVDSSAVGTFRGFGVDVEVALSADTGSRPDPALPLPALIAGWLRAAAAPGAAVECRVVATDTSPIYCAQLGAALRAELDSDPEPRGVLVVADGATTLTAKAPGSFDSRAPEFQDELFAALANGDCEAVAELDPVVCLELGVSGRAAWQVLAGMFRDPPRCTTAYADAPYGVGYHVGLWTP